MDVLKAKSSGKNICCLQMLSGQRAFCWLVRMHLGCAQVLGRVDVTGDGFAPSLVSAIFASCAIEGFLPGWLNIISMPLRPETRLYLLL